MSTTSLRTLVPRGLNTIVKENNIARFVDPQFTIDKLRLSRSAYLGHLESGNQKGKKIYSPNRPLPTLVQYVSVVDIYKLWRSASTEASASPMIIIIIYIYIYIYIVAEQYIPTHLTTVTPRSANVYIPLILYYHLILRSSLAWLWRLYMSEPRNRTLSN